MEFSRPVPTRYASHGSGAKYLLGGTREAIPPPIGKHILIVDDDPNFRSLFKVMLTQTGFPLASISEVEESGAAVDLCREYPLDIVFCDLNLSRLWPRKGIITVYDIRKLRPQLPIYMVTAENTYEIIEKVVHAGATGHILKPLNLRVLRRALTATFPFSSSQL